jgi:hypothetical protein
MATDLILVPQICLNMPKQYYAPAKVGRQGLPKIKKQIIIMAQEMRILLLRTRKSYLSNIVPYRIEVLMLR